MRVGYTVENNNNSRAMMDDKFFDNENSYLTFSLGAECYGISIKNISEIIGIQDITKVPGMPKFISGIINLRGMIVPVMNLRAKFEKTEISYNDRTCIIIIEIDNIFLGLIVDTVLEVVKIGEDQISPSPSITSYESNFIDGIGQYNDKVALLLNGEKLLSKVDINNLKAN
jgi:purine-binding chemotaxis protein CheW